MKRILYSLLTLCIIGCLSSCSEKNDDVPAVPAESRTVIVYMIADSNLSSYSNKDMDEIRKAAINGDLGNSNLLIYLDSYTKDPQLLRINQRGESEVLKDYDHSVMSVTAERMTQVLGDALKAAPAQAYGLILWGHATGWLQNGIEQPAASTLSYGGERGRYWMNTTTLAGVLEQFSFDWVYFDCCYMGSVETAYELRHVTDYIIASPTELPAAGMPYDKTLKYLMPYESDLRGACMTTFYYYDKMIGEDRTCTMSLIKTSALDKLAERVRGMYTSFDAIPAVSGVQRYTLDYPCYYYDLEDYCMELATSPAATKNQLIQHSLIRSALDEAVLVNVATPFLWDIIPLTDHCGLSTFIIENQGDAATHNYTRLQWWKDVVAPAVK